MLAAAPRPRRACTQGNSVYIELSALRPRRDRDARVAARSLGGAAADLLCLAALVDDLVVVSATTSQNPWRSSRGIADDAVTDVAKRASDSSWFALGTICGKRATAAAAKGHTADAQSFELAGFRDALLRYGADASSLKAVVWADDGRFSFRSHAKLSGCAAKSAVAAPRAAAGAPSPGEENGPSMTPPRPPRASVMTLSSAGDRWQGLEELVKNNAVRQREGWTAARARARHEW